VAYYLNIKSTVKHEGEEAFRLVSFSGHEEISRLFSFTLELLSPRDDIKPSEIIGKPISFSFQDAANQPRWFHGFVSRFSASGGETGQRQYQAEVVPWLWFLTQTADCRIFAEKSVPQILEEVFKDVDSAIKQPVQMNVPGGYRIWTYCVQYRETDFNFVSRLMEQEGIFYYFKHEEGKHTLVLCDRAADYQTTGTVVKYEYSYAGEPQSESVTAWEHEYQFVPGKYTQTDYEFEDLPARGQKDPNKALESSSVAQGGSKDFVDAEKYEIYDYPGEYETKSEGDAYTELRMEEEEVEYDVATGSSRCEYLTPGGKFTLREHPASSENGEYAITSIDHSAADSAFSEGEGDTYSNSFTCIPASITFRPARETPKPSIDGVQTAVVVGPGGSEINTDEQGRVQVQFFWDRRGTRLQGEQEPPAWIRVGQIIAGKNWGAMFIPRVGQEVIVTFLEGDPDRPLITGVVYNGEQTPPYDPQENPTRSYIKTNSSPDGEGYNELRFEDSKDNEQIFIHAQRNMDTRVVADSMESVGKDRHLTVGEDGDEGKVGDQKEQVYRDKDLIVHRNHTEHIGGDMKLLIGGIDGPGNQEIVVKADKKELLQMNSHLKVGADRNEDVGGNQSLTVGGNQQEKVGMKHAVEAGQEVHIKAGMKVILEAGMQLTIKGPGGFVDIGPAGVTIQGTLVNINSGGSAGAGSGSSPTGPEDAEEAEPAEPDWADIDTTGQKSTPF